MPSGPIRPPARTRYNFALDLLETMGLPTSENNIRALLAQMLAEEPAGEGAGNNPLNTTMDLGKYHPWSASPNIPEYPSWSVGLSEAAKTYQLPAYASVIRDLKASATPQKTVSDIGASPWGTSGSLMQQILSSGGDLARNATIPGSGDPPGTIVGPGGGGIQGAVGDAAHSVTSTVGDAVHSAVSIVEDFALRAGKILLGIILLAAAIFIGVKQ